MSFISKISNWYFSKDALPYWGILLIDSFIICLGSIIALLICKKTGTFVDYFWSYTVLAICSLPFYWVGMRIFHTYSGILRYSSFIDLARVGGSVIFGGVSFYLFFLAGEHLEYFPWLLRWKYILVAMICSSIGMWSMRIAVKYMFDFSAINQNARNALIFGVREGGIALGKSMRNEHPSKYILQGFISTEDDMVGRYLLGCKVFPADDKIVNIIKEEHIQDIFISPLLSDEFRNNENLVNNITKAGVRVMMMPTAESWDGKSDLSHTLLHEVDIEDLLPRDKIQVDMDAIGEMLHGKCILITGAAGSIGSEMARQVARFNPSTLVLVDQAETPMHDVRLFMSNNYPDMNAPTIVGSITNQSQMERIFRQYRPEYVFHAAAYKHVPMMEDNPAMAVQNNIYGTRVIADLAVKYGTKKFVMISTDKAVNPTNVMGCSKRICEIYCQSLNQAIVSGTLNLESLKPETGIKPCTQFVTTRFGNVLGSNGSVIPIFKEQIKRGGPVTVTHPEIIRFFMLIPEACQLVLEAGTMGKGGEIFVFDMGKPVRIADLAQRMIDLSGAKNIEIKYTGLRDGEKLYEEVLNDEEGNRPTVHPKIKVAQVREYPYEEALRNEEELYDLSFTYNDMEIVKKMKEIVPEYKSRVSKYEVLDK